MPRVYNFSPGPAALPLEVLEQARNDLPDWQGTGMSVMEISHRSKEFAAVAETAEANLRELLAVPDNYRVLFLQGGATLQFAMAPMNLAARGDVADYVVTGSWGKKAAAEAATWCKVNVAADGKTSGFNKIPAVESWHRSRDAAYLHYTPNETIGGVEFHFVPDSADVPLVVDMSSTILSRPVDVSSFGVIYAGAQKNIGPAGLTLVLVREDLLERVPDDLPRMLSYKALAASGSMLNTPPTFAWYLAGLVFEWLKAKGGLDAVGACNRRKQEKLYGFIDESDFYRNPVAGNSRSWMNVPFTLADPALDALFLSESAAAGLVNLKGHRSVGGMRASIYNAMPEEGVDALIGFMQHFESRHG